MAEYPAAIIRTSSLKWFKKCPEIIRLAVMYVRFPRSLRDVGVPLTIAAASSAMRQCGSGGIASGRCSHPRSGNAGSRAWNPAAGDGTSTRCS